MNKNIYEKVSSDIQLGATVQIHSGRIEVLSDDKPVNTAWYESNEKEIIALITKELSMPAYEYESYSAGFYGPIKNPTKWSGVTLQFLEINSLEPAYIIFNADLKAKRSSIKKTKGAKKEPGKFIVGKRSTFFKFWNEAGLAIPNNRMSKICERMSWLKPIIFTGDIETKEKLNKQSLKPLMVSYSTIHNLFTTDNTQAGYPIISHTHKTLFTTDNTRTRNGQHTDKIRTRNADKETQQTQQPQGLEPNQTTGFSNHSIRLKGNAVIQSPITPSNTLSNNPINQTVDEWLSDYESEPTTTN
jgi:hypothetical protein